MPDDLSKKVTVEKKLDPGLQAMVEDVYVIKVKGSVGVRAHRGPDLDGRPVIEITSADANELKRVEDVLSGKVSGKKAGFAIKTTKIKAPTKDTIKRMLMDNQNKAEGLLE